MNSKLSRRAFHTLALSSAVGGALASLAMSSAVFAQGPKSDAAKPEFKLIQPVRTPDVDKGKIEVIEFFWYGCPHCSALEPSIVAWKAKLAPDVVFKKVHVPFREEKHQQLFYALEALGKAEALSDKVFYAIHVDRNPLDNNKIMGEWAAKNGIDAKIMEQTLESFGVKAKMKKASRMTTEYGVDGVPALAVNGKYYTAPSMAGGNAAALRLVDKFIEQERQAKK